MGSSSSPSRDENWNYLSFHHLSYLHLPKTNRLVRFAPENGSAKLPVLTNRLLRLQSSFKGL